MTSHTPPRPVLTCVDPALPLCWESPDTLRLGFDRAEVRIPTPSAATQRLLDALRTGVPFGGLSRVAQHVGASAAERRALIERLAPVLVSRPATPTGEPCRTPGFVRLRIAVLGTSEAAAVLREACARAGHDAFEWRPDSEPVSAQQPVPTPQPTPQPRSDQWIAPIQPRPDLVIAVERFLLPPRTTQLLIEHEIPHLLVRFSDRGVRVGPLVRPGSGPCTVCVALHDTDADPSLPALAVQLPGVRPASETPACAETAASMAMSAIHHWLAGAHWPHLMRQRAEVHDGLPMPGIACESLAVHPNCGCGLLELGSAAAPFTPRR